MIISFNRFLALTMLTLLSCVSEAQQTTTFYDKDWKICDISNARFYSIVKKTDSGWLRNDYYIGTEGLQMTGLFKDSLCKIKNGEFLYFFVNDRLKSRGRFLDNKKIGLHLRYHYNGMLADSSTYNNGKLTGINSGWYPNGFMSDSVFVKNDSITINIEWFDNGNISEYGYYINDKKHGQWNYFHKQGGQAAIELNDHGKTTSVEYFNEDGSVQPDTSLVHREATFKKRKSDWSDYLSGKIYWPPEYKITNNNTASVETSFVIDEDGKVSEYFISIPFHRLLDNIAIDAIKKSPLWVPALDHNRRVKAYRKQPITFTQE